MYLTYCGKPFTMSVDVGAKYLVFKLQEHAPMQVSVFQTCQFID